MGVWFNSNWYTENGMSQVFLSEPQARFLSTYPSILFRYSCLEEESLGAVATSFSTRKVPPLCIYELQRWGFPRGERSFPRALQLYQSRFIVCSGYGGEAVGSAVEIEVAERKCRDGVACFLHQHLAPKFAPAFIKREEGCSVQQRTGCGSKTP